MSIREYISQKLQAFQLGEHAFIDFAFTNEMDVEAEYTADVQEKVNIAIVGIIEDLVFAPRPTSISESGFSVSWNYDTLGRYYMWLCRKYGLTPKEEIAEMLGISMITDKTNIW